MTHILISHVEQKAETALDLSKAIETKRSPIISGVMLPGSEKVLLALQDHSLEIWDVRKGRREKLFSENIVHPSDIWLNDLTVSADGVYAVLSWDQEMCEVWNLATGEYTEIVPHRYQVFSAVVDPDSKQLLSVGDEAGIVRFRDLQKNE